MVATPGQPVRLNVAADLVSFRDLDFARVPVVVRSAGGTPFTRWVPTGMPRIPPIFLNSVAYLYRSEDDARAGRDFGGTAFLVCYPLAVPNRFALYAVTTWHVACQDGSSVLRVNTLDGGSDILPFGPEDWHFDPKYDIAVIEFPLDKQKHSVNFIHTSMFLSKDGLAQARMTAGEDVFMVGRFIDHDGGVANKPAVRFGNISVMPSPIEQSNGGQADSYCLDMHSRSGYSGSPVFVYRTAGYDLEDRLPGKGEPIRYLLAGRNLLNLLGIHFAQFPELYEIEGGRTLSAEARSVPLVTSGRYVKGLSGMTCVLPAWSILEVLDTPALKARRDATACGVEITEWRGRSAPTPEDAG